MGRFFAGGHAKRHDVILEAFRELLGRVGGGIELHLAGSSSPLQPNMEYVAQLQTMAADLPVTFHLNPSPETLRALYARAPVYWHATGYGLPPDDAGGERSISVSASWKRCPPAACPLPMPRAGLARSSRTGFIGLPVRQPGHAAREDGRNAGSGDGNTRVPIAQRAAVAARRYSADIFADAVRELVREAGLMRAQSPL